MIKHLLLLLSIILIAGSSITQAQELEARVTINHQQVQGTVRLFLKH